MRRVENSATVAGRVAASLGEIVDATERVHTLLEEVSAAGVEQVGGIGVVNQKFSDFNPIVQRVAANAEELSATAIETSAEASTMRELVAQFEVGSARDSD